ncbi:MAG TPA: Hpt domain-containing protein, partial [Methylomirabilota bacterium]
MADRRERELLLGIFLMEAWDTAGALEENLGLLTGTEAPSPESLSPLAVFAHRLKGSAALHGFPGVADLAATAERLLEEMPRASVDERRAAAVFLDGLVSLLKDVFDGISAVGVEDGDRIAGFKSRYPTVLSWTPASSSPTVTPAAVAPTSPRATSLLTADLSRFFLESGEVLEYFVPEATEHLETLTTSLLALEGGARDEETLATIFRAAHTLKGAAYTVGCAPIGDATHHIEDLLGAVRARRIPVTPAITEAVFAGTSAIKRVLHAGPAMSEEVAHALELATHGLRSLLASEATREPQAPAEHPVVPVATLEPDTEAPQILEPPAAPATAVEAVPGFVRPEFLARLEALPRPAVRAASTPSGPSIRVPIERLDTLLNLVGELMIARSRLDRRLSQLDQVSELLLASRTRLGQIGRDFEFRRHLSPLPGRTPTSGRDRDGDLRDLSELFAELEFDHYDDVNVLARSVTETSADVAEVQSQHVALLRSIREDSAHVQRLTAALRKEITRARMVPIGRLFTRVAQQVREVARAADKTVKLTVRGEAAEVDNSIIE